VKRLLGIAIGIFVSALAVFGQTVDAPAKWIGTWTLIVEKSKFGTILMPDAPLNLIIVSERLKIEQNQVQIRLSGDTVMAESDGFDRIYRNTQVAAGHSYSTHDDYKLSLDGTETTDDVGSFSFVRTSDSSFDIIARLNIKDGDLGEVSHFLLSADGKTLSETKTQTDKTSHRTSKFVLVFKRVPER
jgi:hypothetical protein